MEYTKCRYVGEVVHGRMESNNATFHFNPSSQMLHYQGEMKDGMFHGTGVITMKNGAKVRGEWKYGQIVSRQYIFNDGLEYNEDLEQWDYCQSGNGGGGLEADRRFYEERINENTLTPHHAGEGWGLQTSSSGVQPAIPDETQLDTLSHELQSKHGINK